MTCTPRVACRAAEEWRCRPGTSSLPSLETTLRMKSYDVHLTVWLVVIAVFIVGLIELSRHHPL